MVSGTQAEVVGSLEIYHLSYIALFRQPTAEVRVSQNTSKPRDTHPTVFRAMESAHALRRPLTMLANAAGTQRDQTASLVLLFNLMIR
jgi:hypothetical protein